MRPDRSPNLVQPVLWTTKKPVRNVFLSIRGGLTHANRARQLVRSYDHARNDPAGTLEPQGRCRITDVMRKPKHTAQIENIYFLSRIGSTLRWATQDIAR